MHNNTDGSWLDPNGRAWPAAARDLAKEQQADADRRRRRQRRKMWRSRLLTTPGSTLWVYPAAWALCRGVHSEVFQITATILMLAWPAVIMAAGVGLHERARQRVDWWPRAANRGYAISVYVDAVILLNFASGWVTHPAGWHVYAAGVAVMAFGLQADAGAWRKSS